MRMACLLSLVTVAPLIGCAAEGRKVSAVERERFSQRRVIAVLGENRTGNPYADSAVAGLEGVLTQTLLDRGYRVVDRAALVAVDKERMLREAGITDSQAGQLGKLAGADAILLARVTKVEGGRSTVGGQLLAIGAREGTGSAVYTYESRARVEARLVDLEANILWQTSANATDTVGAPGDLGRVLELAAEKAAEEVPPKSIADAD
ncbi:MAG TPA: CsgG/HfaB family protein [Phycisphaerae bacterium]|nr:CsgG/HfaB family protein [Phycisphaerae bacterium]